MLLLTLVVQLVLARIASNDVDRVLQDRADAVISAATRAGRRARRPRLQLDAGVAVYDDQGTLVAVRPAEPGEQYQDLAEQRPGP